MFVKEQINPGKKSRINLPKNTETITIKKMELHTANKYEQNKISKKVQ